MVCRLLPHSSEPDRSRSTAGHGVLVAFGDSITDGTQSGNRPEPGRWPDILASRLAAAGIHLSVVNGGIGGAGAFSTMVLGPTR